ncbi:PLDc N-terminal domain-containing protein, partial [Enterococcus faecium]
PLIIVQFGLLIYVLHHIFTHSAYKHGNRMIWVIIVIVGMQFIGPVLYLIFGKEDA